MKAPKILPWIARKAGISDELALKLWRRAISEAEYLTGRADGSEYWGLAIERFLDIVEEEIGTTPQYGLTPRPQDFLDVAPPVTDVAAFGHGCTECLSFLADHLGKSLRPKKSGLTGRR